jgi:high affinity Mn2+ porin
MCLTLSNSFTYKTNVRPYNIQALLFPGLLIGTVAVAAGAPSTDAAGDETPAPWNWHAQSTTVLEGHSRFTAPYEGIRSLPDINEARETVSFDLTGGVHLWDGAAAFADALVWQGYGLGNAVGIEAFPNGEAFRLGTRLPNITMSRLFVRQTFGFGGPQEAVEDGPLQLSGKRDVSRLTFTAGKMSAKDVFDNNAYANDPRSQFLDWSLMANNAWDFPADALGYITGAVAELNQQRWALRYGFFQTPRRSNGMALDLSVLKAWAMVTEFEWRYALGERPGTLRVLGSLNRADMGSYGDAVAAGTVPADITLSRSYRTHLGFGLNWEQAVTRDLGLFSRLGWSDGKTEAWHFNDVDRTATAGLSIQGTGWGRPTDTFGLGGGFNGISRVHQQFLAAGGYGILAGDGALSYGWEQFLETYYSLGLTRWLHASVHYEFVANPAFNRDRGPVHVFGARVHFEF